MIIGSATGPKNAAPAVPEKSVEAAIYGAEDAAPAVPIGSGRTSDSDRSSNRNFVMFDFMNRGSDRNRRFRDDLRHRDNGRGLRAETIDFHVTHLSGIFCICEASIIRDKPTLCGRGVLRLDQGEVVALQSVYGTGGVRQVRVRSRKQQIVSRTPEDVVAGVSHPSGTVSVIGKETDGIEIGLGTPAAVALPGITVDSADSR